MTTSGRTKESLRTFGRRKFVEILCLLLTTIPTSSCSDAITQLLEARRLAAEARVHFNQATDASNRAVMATTDEASTAFAREAEQAKQATQRDADALAPLVRDLHSVEASRRLEEFSRHFTEYQALDHTLLELAVENTNLKAQKLAFGVAHEAVAAFRKSIDAATRAAASKNHDRVESLVASAVLALREIEVLHAPHIAESDDSAMSRIEKEMDALFISARGATESLSALVDPAAGAELTNAALALERFKGIHDQIIELSRRNSNVRSLELALGKGRTLTAACDTSLSALQTTLAKEGFKATR